MLHAKHCLLSCALLERLHCCMQPDLSTLPLPTNSISRHATDPRFSYAKPTRIQIRNIYRIRAPLPTFPFNLQRSTKLPRGDGRAGNHRYCARRRWLSRIEDQP